MSNQLTTGTACARFDWLKQRRAGVLLHPTALPGAQGIGVLDDAVDRFLAFLVRSGVSYWQVCPLGPTGYGDSPYQCFSSFAGNPYLVDLTPLLHKGLLDKHHLATLGDLPTGFVDFGWLYVAKLPLLFKAHAAYAAKPRPLPYGDFKSFQKTHAAWLEPYAAFMALKDRFGGKPWWEWPKEARFLSTARKSPWWKKVADRAEAHAFFQYLFYGQWAVVRAKAAACGISLIGDAPIFVARDSADVWARPDLFQIEPDSGQPHAVAGVPPDYFSADGQLWGNPLYHWEAHAAEGYAWWLDRLRSGFGLCDVMRIDHFRAFDTYWSIPADAATAKSGEWRHGPGLAFFEAVKAALPDARLIAEDLGDLAPSVRELRDASGLPGMTILQFAFGGDSDNLYLPHNLTANSVVYPGTHDNNTTLGWYVSADEKTRDHVRRYLRVSGEVIHWDFIRTAYESVSRLAVVPFQDLLGCGAAGRFNTPGEPAGNWQWRYQAEELDGLNRDSADYLASLGRLYGRGGA